MRFHGNEITPGTSCCAVGDSEWHDIIEILTEILDPAQRKLIESAPEPTSPATNPKEAMREKTLRRIFFYIAFGTLLAPLILWTVAYRWIHDPWTAILLGIISIPSGIIAFVLFQILFITRNQTKIKNSSDRAGTNHATCLNRLRANQRCAHPGH